MFFPQGQDARQFNLPIFAMQQLFSFASQPGSPKIPMFWEGNREAKMTLTRNLNMLAFFVAFLFLTAIVVGIV